MQKNNIAGIIVYKYIEAGQKLLYLSVPSYFIRLFHTGTAFNNVEVFLL